MKVEKEFTKIVKKISKKEIKRLRKYYRECGNIEVYLYETNKKIFKRIFFPYFRFEILLNCIKDILKNNKYYQDLQK